MPAKLTNHISAYAKLLQLEDCTNIPGDENAGPDAIDEKFQALLDSLEDPEDNTEWRQVINWALAGRYIDLAQPDFTVEQIEQLANRAGFWMNKPDLTIRNFLNFLNLVAKAKRVCRAGYDAINGTLPLHRKETL